MRTQYYYEVSFEFSNEGLIEMMTLTEALKINFKVDWSPLHVWQNCRIVRFVYQLSLELFLHNNHVSIDTFSHEQLYSWVGLL